MAQLPDGFMSLPLKKVTPKVIDDLYRFLAEPLSRKPATVLRFHTVLRAAFAQAVRWGWVDRNPVDRATPRGSTVTRSRRRQSRTWSAS